MIIFDCGSGNSCRNDLNIARGMIKEIADLRVPGAVIKWQLFTSAGNNIPLNRDIFDSAYRYAQILGLGTTASVFDEYSLDFLLTYNIPFVKLANNQKSQELLKKIPERFRVIISTDKPDFKTDRPNTDIIYCVSEYPAKEKDYDKFGEKLKKGISDHTENFNLFHKWQPKIYECHFKCFDTTGLDAGTFARTPEQIKSILPKKEINLEEVLAGDK